jgi:hypothetical protein
MSIPVPPEDLRATEDERKQAKEAALEKMMSRRDEKRNVIPFGNIDLIHAEYEAITRIVRDREDREMGN